MTVALPLDTDPKLAEYAHPERLVTTSWLSFASASPKKLPICGRAGSMISIDSAVSAISRAISATNSPKDVGNAGPPKRLARD